MLYLGWWLAEIWTRQSGESPIADSSKSRRIYWQVFRLENGSAQFAMRVRTPTDSKERDSMMQKDLKELLLAFNEQGVEYLVVGGYAVGVHSEPRATKDLDIFIQADVRNSEAVFRALGAYDARLEGLTAENCRDEPASIFQIGIPPRRINIL
jgi:hypothetical protein